MEGLHSPFGQLHQLVNQTHWPLKKILWEVNFPTLMLMAADAPRYVTGEKVKKVQIASEEQLSGLLNQKYSK